jgi:hypothetical protein
MGAGERLTLTTTRFPLHQMERRDAKAIPLAIIFGRLSLVFTAQIREGSLAAIGAEEMNKIRSRERVQ